MMIITGMEVGSGNLSHSYLLIRPAPFLGSLHMYCDHFYTILYIFVSVSGVSVTCLFQGLSFRFVFYIENLLVLQPKEAKRWLSVLTM